jgi:class 3 adenylate cyclase
MGGDGIVIGSWFGAEACDEGRARPLAALSGVAGMKPDVHYVRNEGVALAYQLIGDGPADLPAVRVPTLVLTRTGDQAQPIEGGRYIAAKIPGARFVELPGNDAAPWVGDAGSVLSEIEQFLEQSSGRASGPERRLGTVLFTDIVGSTEHLAGMGDAAWRVRLAEHDRIARKMIERSGGDYINTTGDGFLATFSGPAAAVRCALDVGDALRPLGLEVRAGVHTGELEIAEKDIRGMAVHIGARVMSLAQPSEVLASSTVKDLAAGSGIVFEDWGEHELKGVPDRWHLYRVRE